jgi:hypothetical protein
MIEFYGGYQVYSESGVDLTLLRRNMELPLEERLLNNSRMLPFIEELRRAGAKQRGESDQGRGRPAMLQVEELLRRLVLNRVEFVLIGGLAMRAHGSAHITEDLDICYGRSPTNINALAAALAAIHPYLRGAPLGLPFKFDAKTIQAGLNFTLTTDLGDVDLLGEVRGVGTYEEARAEAEEMTLFGVPIRVLSLNALLLSKKAAGRSKDLGHIAELEELKKLRDADKKG